MLLGACGTTNQFSLSHPSLRIGTSGCMDNTGVYRVTALQERPRERLVHITAGYAWSSR